jgi:hypothetical protein
MTAKRARELGFADDVVDGDATASEHEPSADNEAQEVDVNVTVTSQRHGVPGPVMSSDAPPRRLVHLASLKNFARAAR